MRHDHTEWLTHFVRGRNPAQDFPFENEEQNGWFCGGELGWNASAFDVLKTIIRLGGITPGYSFRGGRTTIYGGQPAICATEMPIYSFASYARDRADPTSVSAYGISFLKSEFYAAGGRQAIYGLSTDQVRYIKNDTLSRIFEDSILPLREQYRYVAHNPASYLRRIDWSHEREWRWIAQDLDLDEIWAKNYNGQLDPIPALPIFKGQLEGRSFTRLCVIVWSQEEAEEIRRLITSLYLASSNNYDTPFDKNLLLRSRIIVLKDVVDAVESKRDLDAQTIEGLARAQLLQAVVVTTPPTNAAATVAAAMAAAGAAATNATALFVRKGNGFILQGFAHAVTYDVTHPIVQYMLSSGEAMGPFDGAVWIKYPGAYGATEIDLAVNVAQAASDVLSSQLGIDVHVETRLD